MSGKVYKLVTRLREFCTQYKLKNQILIVENNILKERLSNVPCAFNIDELKIKHRKEKNKLNTMIVVHGIDYVDIPFDERVAARRKEKINEIHETIWAD